MWGKKKLRHSIFAYVTYSSTSWASTTVVQANNYTFLISLFFYPYLFGRLFFVKSMQVVWICCTIFQTEKPKSASCFLQDLPFLRHGRIPNCSYYHVLSKVSYCCICIYTHILTKWTSLKNSTCRILISSVCAC